MGIDDRVLKALAILGWTQPTLIQEKAIPLALDGNDILARARTGSGKTAVFAIPVIDKILRYKQKNTMNTSKTYAIILAPSKDLCKQLTEHIQQLTACCSREVTSVNVADREIDESRSLLLSLVPDIVIGTPAKILANIKAGSLKNLNTTLQSFVVDEADLLFSFGYEKPMQELIELAVPKKGCQSYLLSATLNPDIIKLKNLVLHKPVILKLEEPELPKSDQLAQYHISCQEDEKFVILIALIKLNLLRGRSIIFVNSLKRCYKVKLFLEQFAVRSCLLNQDLPIESRCNIVDQFNKGVYNIIIACDERCVHDPTARKKKTTMKQRVDKDFAVSRGIDFQSVSNVINFDFPISVTSYVHRVGRTARALVAINSNITMGTVLSFVAQDEHRYFKKVKSAFGDADFKPYAFKMQELEAFKYRSKDAIRAVTKDIIRATRIKEIRHELRNSERLKSILKSNSNDAELLRHDKIKKITTPSHLKDVPDYIVPPTLKTRQRRLDIKADLSEPTSRRSAKLKKNKKKRSVDPLRAKSSRKGGMRRKKTKQTK